MQCRFDFTGDRDGLDGALARTYLDPLRVLTATKPDECRAVLAEAEAELDSGRHVAGFISYEAAAALDPKKRVNPQRLQDLPLLQFGIYAEAGQWQAVPHGKPFATTPWRAGRTEAEHAADVAAIHGLIGSGDTYQVNHTIRLRSGLEGDPLDLYAHLHAAQPAAWSAWIDAGTHQLLSCSPELFFLRREGRLVTRPMKGTSRRSADHGEDEALKAALLASPKERAENVMITDLLRNDLAMVAKSGSVTVDRLLELETHPTFHALTSTVSAEPEEDIGLAAVLEALFPCGSITGAPKLRTMEIIAELEPEPRGLYCGTMGFADPNGTWAFNVAIRTVQHAAASGELVYGTGGGITWDSDAAAEYREALLKASFVTGGRLNQ